MLVKVVLRQLAAADDDLWLAPTVFFTVTISTAEYYNVDLVCYTNSSIGYYSLGIQSTMIYIFECS